MSGVSEAAVEAAATAMYDSVAVLMRFPTGWDEAPDSLRDSYRGMAQAAYAAIRADIAAEVLAAWHLGVLDGRRSGMLRMEPKSPYDGAFYDRQLALDTAAALSAANDNGATSPHETAPNAAEGNLAPLTGTSAAKETP